MPVEIDYSHWRDEYKSILELLVKRKIYIAFSAGKDSSLSLDFILRAGKEFGFDFETDIGASPIHRYTDTERNRIGSYWSNRGVDIVWHGFLKTDEQLNKAENPCNACQKVRKDLLKTIVTEEIRDLENFVLIISFSLWDIVGYSIEHILSDMFHNYDPEFRKYVWGSPAIWGSVDKIRSPIG